MLRRLLAGACLILVGAGCSSSSDTELTAATGEFDELEARIETLEMLLDQADDTLRQQAEELEGARRMADCESSADQGLSDKLEQCEHLLLDVQKYPIEQSTAPSVVFLPRRGYRTAQPTLSLHVMAGSDWTVTIDDSVGQPFLDYAGDLTLFTADVDLVEGSNSIDVTARSPAGDDTDLSMVVLHDPTLEQGYGLILAAPVVGSGPGWEAGVDFVEVELGGEFGNSYDNPIAVIEHFPVTSDAVGIFRDGATGFSFYSDDLLVLGGSEIRDIFYGFHGHPERLDGDPHTWIFSILSKNNQIVQLEPIPIGS